MKTTGRLDLQQQIDIGKEKPVSEFIFLFGQLNKIWPLRSLTYRNRDGSLARSSFTLVAEIMIKFNGDKRVHD